MKRKLENYMTDMGSTRQNHHEVAISAHSHGYEVFLSFKGDDTRKGFTDQLYQQMVDAGISVFKDNVNLSYGEEIGTSLSKGIEMSKIAMPILSKNYGASRWCLDELVCMLECRNTRKQKVLPIFYDVTPSQVRHQTYATAFANEETREKWRKSLKEVTSLKGLELEKETGGHEGQFTKMILAKVLVELKKSHLRVTDKLVGIDDQEKKVKDLLAIDAKDDRKVVGLWGMGGIGKTTLAKLIYNQILDKFESCSFLSDIREKSLEHNGVERLQSWLVSDLSRQKRRDFSSIDEGVNELERMFHNKKVLILLDDVDNIDQLEALAGNINWFGPGTRIIVTTRNKSIMDDLLRLSNDVDIAQECWWYCYEVKEMNKKKALQLFCKHAFRQDDPEDKFSALSHAIVKTTGGLPLALEVIGSFLSRKRKSIWEETLIKLRRMPKEEVQERLKISYKRLDDDQKQMFLDVACLFIGEDIDVVMHVWKDRSFCAEIGKDALLVMSLIKIVDNKIWMHDQLRDLGREIVRKENYKEPRKRSRLWQEDEARDAIANNSMVYGSSSEVEALHLHNDSNQDSWITSEQLRNYMNIWFLKLHRVNLTGDFRHLLSKLRWLRWQCSSEDCPPTNLNLERLLFLDLSFSCIKDDWKLWSSFQSSKKIKVLNLRSCSGLITLDVSMFINLERLVVDYCVLLKEISVGELENLIFLSMENCWRVEKLSIWSLPNLQVLVMANCWLIKELPDSIGNLESLTELDLSGTRFTTFPSSIWGLKNLQVLKILNSSISCMKDKILGRIFKEEGASKQNDALKHLNHLILFWIRVRHAPSNHQEKSLIMKLEKLILENIKLVQTLEGDSKQFSAALQLQIILVMQHRHAPSNYQEKSLIMKLEELEEENKKLVRTLEGVSKQCIAVLLQILLLMQHLHASSNYEDESLIMKLEELKEENKKLARTLEGDSKQYIAALPLQNLLVMQHLHASSNHEEKSSIMKLEELEEENKKLVRTLEGVSKRYSALQLQIMQHRHAAPNHEVCIV